MHHNHIIAKNTSFLVGKLSILNKQDFNGFLVEILILLSHQLNT